MKQSEKKVLVLSILGVLVMITLISGITYAYFSSRIEGDNAKINVTTALLGPLKYTGTTITTNGILPGWISNDMELKVEGPTNTEEGIDYYCYIDNIGDISDIEYRVSNDNESTSENSEWKSITDEYIIHGNININNQEDIYKIGIRYKETGLNQNHQQGKSIIVRTSCYLEEIKPDASILAWTLNGSKQAGTFPTKDTEYAVSSVDCTNGAIGTWDNNRWAIIVEGISTTPAKCTVNFVTDGIELYKQILNNNTNVQTRSDFNTIYTLSNNGNTIYVASGQDGADTYYFAGQVTNNYVKFGTNSSGAELWWRIVRVNEDGSVRLIYAGTSKDDTAAFISTSQAFNASYNMSYYVGYERSTTQHGTGTNSDIKGVVDTWYTNNLADEAGYLSQTAIYCNDRTMGTGYTWAANPSDVRLYAGYERLVSKYTSQSYYNKDVAPTFACSENADRFTVSNTTGNGALENPIALITADEVAYAGAFFATDNASYYIAQNASSGASWWWTMSPSDWFGSYARVFRVGGSSDTGYLGWYSTSNASGVRPVTSLKSCVTWKTGNGTADSPYEVELSDECATLEN